jgi:transcriptional regulator of acetoin/glycerol metabolism
MDRLRAYAWPGNVRELQNVVEYAALQAGGGEMLLVRHLPEEVRDGIEVPGKPGAPMHIAVPSAGFARAGRTREDLLALLARHGGSRVAAARELGVSRVTLWKWMKRLGMGGREVPDG